MLLPPCYEFRLRCHNARRHGIEKDRTGSFSGSSLDDMHLDVYISRNIAVPFFFCLLILYVRAGQVSIFIGHFLFRESP